MVGFQLAEESVVAVGYSDIAEVDKYLGNWRRHECLMPIVCSTFGRLFC